MHAAGEAAAYVREHGRHQGGLAARIMHERRPVIVTEATADASSPTIRSARRSRRSLGVPLLVDERPIGALHVGTLFAARVHRRRGRPAAARRRPRRARRSSARGCSSASTAIAEELQRSLLPARRCPRVPGLAMAARYLPGGAGTQVGGDWYDTIPLPGGRVALVIGDVAGRGIDAAAMMGQLRSALRAYALEGRRPARRSSA